MVGYLVATSLIFYLVDAIYTVPLSAMVVEATGDYQERVRVNVFLQIGVFLTSIGVQWIFPFIQSRLFTGPLTGVRHFSILFGLLLMVTAFAPVMINKERLYHAARSQKKGAFIANIKIALSNRPFVIIMAVRSIFTFTYNIVGVLGLYLNYYYIYRGNIRQAAIMQGWNGTLFQLAAISSLFLFKHLSARYGKSNAMMCAAGILAFGSLGKLFLYIPGLPWLQVFIYIANGAAGAGSVTMANATLADVADYDELATGIRREGIYAAVLGWFERVGNSVGSLFSGFVLIWIGFDVKFGGSQKPGVLHAMQFAYFITPFLGACIIIYLAAIYPLDESICHKMKSCLERRRTARAPMLRRAPQV
jgi:glycoside/pentoside/hexuronide:cation symporter, GPH family